MKPAGNIEQNVIACAHRLFIEKGYVNTSMSDIAAAVGITRPALHYYFRTKERLFRAISRKSSIVNVLAERARMFRFSIPK